MQKIVSALVFTVLLFATWATSSVGASCRIFAKTSKPTSSTYDDVLPVRLDFWSFGSLTAGNNASARHQALLLRPGQPYELFGAGIVNKNLQYKPSAFSMREVLRRGKIHFDSVRSVVEGYVYRHPDRRVSIGLDLPSLLLILQDFSLSVMEKTGLLNARARALQERIANQLDRDQIVIIEVSEVLLGNEVEARIRDFASADIRKTEFDQMLVDRVGRIVQNPVSDDSSTFYHKNGAVWVISANHRKGQKLPLQLDQLSTPIDRSKYKYVFELGRAAQTSRHSFFEAVRGACLAMLDEVVRMGGNPEEAWIFAHSLTSAHANLYRQKFGMQKFADVVGKPQETISVLNLAEFLPIVNLETYHPLAASLRDVAPAMRIVDVLQISLNVSSYFTARRILEVDGVPVGESYFRDFTGVIGFQLLVKQLEARGFGRDSAFIAARIFEKFHDQHHVEMEELAVVGPSGKGMRDVLVEMRAIEIGNFGWDREKINEPQAMISMLREVWLETLHKLRFLGEVDPVEFLKRFNIPIVLSLVKPVVLQELPFELRPTKVIPTRVSLKVNETEDQKEYEQSAMFVYTAENLERMFGRL